MSIGGRRKPFRFGARWTQLLFAIEQLRRRGRSLDVIGLLHLRLKDLSTDLILSLLAEGQGQIANGLKRMGNILPHYIGRAFKELRKRIDAQELDIARQEYAYLPGLSDVEDPLTIPNFRPLGFVEPGIFAG